MKTLLRVSVLCALVVGVMAVAAGAASAAPPCGASSCSTAIFTHTGSPMTIQTAATTASCNAAMTVNTNDPSGSAGNLSVSASSVTGCVDALGSTISVSSTNLPWGGTWTGTTTSGTFALTINKYHVSATNLGSTCTFDLSGTVNGSYTGAAGAASLSISNQVLTVSGSNGAFLCGLIGGNNGQTMTISGTLYDH